MNLVMGMLLLGLLPGSAQAAELNKMPLSAKEQGAHAVAQYEQRANKKTKMVPEKVALPVAKSADGGAEELPVHAVAKDKKDAETAVPADSQERTMRLKGVRG